MTPSPPQNKVSDFGEQQSEATSYLRILRPYHSISGKHRRGLPSNTEQATLSEALVPKLGHFIHLIVRSAGIKGMQVPLWENSSEQKDELPSLRKDCFSYLKARA